MAAVELRAHQFKAIKEMKNGCILKGGVGVGKSITAIAYFFTEVCGGDLKINGFGEQKPMRKPMDLYILTTALKRDKLDWEKEAAPFGLSTKFELSFGGCQVFVDSWNNILKYKDVENAFFIFDEQRLVGKGAWVKTFLQIAKNNKWIVLSATPGDVWMDYIPVFLAHGFYKNRTEFLRRHIVWKPHRQFPVVDRYVDTGILERYRRSITVDMPYEKHTTRHVLNVPTSYDKELFDKVFKQRWNIYEDKPLKDVAELFRIMRKLVNTDPSRLEELRKLARKHDRLIVFYNFNYELDILRTLADEFEFGLHEFAEWNGQKHEEVPTSDKWIYLVQYTAGAEGWNCISTNATVFYSLNYSYKINEQAKGRTERLNTLYKDIFIYVLRSGAMIDNAIVKSLAGKKNFNEKDFIKQ